MATTPDYRVMHGMNEEEEKFVKLDQKFDGAPFYENPLTIVICVILFIIMLVGVFICYKCWTKDCGGPSNNGAAETAPPPPAILTNYESSTKLLEATSSSTVHND